MYLLFDVGGTKTRIGLSQDHQHVGRTEIVDTPKNFEEGMRVFEKIFHDLTQGRKIEKVCGGIRSLDPQKKMIYRHDFRISDWHAKPLRDRISQIVKAPVFLENDAALSALGEAVYGAGKRFKIVAYLTISTGVGGARVVDGKIDKSRFGFEPGKQVIDLDWSKFPELKDLEDEGYGQLEAYISGASLEKRFGKKPQEIVDRSVWNDLTDILSYALQNTIMYWSPDIIILGGGMIETSEFSIKKIKTNLKKVLQFFPELPEIKKAKLGDFSGLYGALAYLRKIPF